MEPVTDSALQVVEKNDALKKIYLEPSCVTLYRYENPNQQYDERREGVVSKKELVGSWFTDDLEEFKDYIKTKMPGGRVVVVRIPKAELENLEAGNIDETRDMDREERNYIIPLERQSETRLEIPVDIPTKFPNKYSFQEWNLINNFVDQNLTSEKLIELIKKS